MGENETRGVLHWNPACTRLALVAIVLAGQLALVFHPDADPPRGLGLEGRWIEEGLAPFDGARRIAGEVGAPDGAAGPPLVTILAGAVFSVLGVGLGPARLLSGLATLLLAMWCAATLRRRFGDGPALLGASLTIFHGVSFTLARTPSIIPLVSLSIVALVHISTRPGRGAPWIALGLVPVLGWLVEAAVTLAAIPILLECLRCVPPVRRTLAHTPFPAAAIASTVATLAWLALPAGSREVILGHVLGGGPRSGPGLLEAAPILLPLAWCGWLIFILHAESRRGPGRRLERSLHGAVWIPLGLRVGAGAGSAAECAEIFPLLIWTGAAAVARVGPRIRRRVLPVDGARGAFACFAGVLGTIWLAFTAQEVWRASEVPGVRTSLLLSGVFITVAFGLPRPGDRTRRAFHVIGAGLLIVPALWWSAAILGHPERTIARAGALAERALLPTARVGGEWARALTLGNDLAWTGSDADPAMSHRIGADGTDPEDLVVSELSMHGEALRLWRMERGISAWSAFEAGRREEREGRGREARRHYYLILHAEPTHAPSWERIAATLLEEGDRENAYRCWLHALLGDPTSPGTREGLARIYLDRDLYDEARFHLRRALEAGTPRERLAPLWDRIPPPGHAPRPD